MVNMGQIKNWIQYLQERKRIWISHISQCPVLLLIEPRTKKERVTIQNASLSLMDDMEALKARLPSESDNWNQVKTGYPVRSGNIDEDAGQAKWYESRLHAYMLFRIEPLYQRCKQCQKLSCYDPDLIPSSILKYLQKQSLYYCHDLEGKISLEYTFKKFPYRNYCSDKCKNEARNKPRRKTKIVKTCPYCGDEYMTVMDATTCDKWRCKKRAYRDKNKA